MKRPFVPPVLLALALAIAAGPARADAIDGHWCHAGGRHFSIAGSQIVTPAGTKTQGDYDRHGFRYTVPPSEAGAGTRIGMVLLGEDTLQLVRGGPGPAKAPETWRRCAAPVS